MLSGTSWYGGTPITEHRGNLTRAGPPSSRTATPLHLRPLAVALVMAGGALGAAAREAIEQAVPTANRGFPAATLVINLAGAFVLGVLLEALVRSGDDSGWRRKARLVAGTGFCGAFTTYSTLAVETVQLGRHGAWSIGVLYLATSAVGGLVAAVGGIALGAAHARWSTGVLPVDPDVDRIGERR